MVEDGGENDCLCDGFRAGAGRGGAGGFGGGEEGEVDGHDVGEGEEDEGEGDEAPGVGVDCVEFEGWEEGMMVSVGCFGRGVF